MKKYLKRDICIAVSSLYICCCFLICPTDFFSIWKWNLINSDTLEASSRLKHAVILSSGSILVENWMDVFRPVLPHVSCHLSSVSLNLKMKVKKTLNTRVFPFKIGNWQYRAAICYDVPLQFVQVRLFSTSRLLSTFPMTSSLLRSFVYFQWPFRVNKCSISLYHPAACIFIDQKSPLVRLVVYRGCKHTEVIGSNRLTECNQMCFSVETI